MENSLSQIIHIDRQQKDAVYKQIVYQFINAVKQGQLYIGSQLPGSRIMAQELGIHRRTMVAALEELRAQDWIEVVPNVGTFIKNPEESNTKLSTSTIKKEIEIPLVTNYILDLPNWDLQSSYTYNDGLPDYSLINSQELARFYSGVLNRKKIKTIGTPSIATIFIIHKSSIISSQPETYEFPKRISFAQEAEKLY